MFMIEMLSNATLRAIVDDACTYGILHPDDELFAAEVELAADGELQRRLRARPTFAQVMARNVEGFAEMLPSERRAYYEEHYPG